MDKYFVKYNNLVKGDEELLELSGYVAGDEEHLYHHMIGTPLTADLSAVHEFYMKHSPETQSHVLITTGSFAPMHEGHVELALKGVQTVEEATGETVIGCWYSIDHSDYVKNKKKVHQYTTMERVNHAQKTIEKHKKLHIDYWSALYAPTDVNFTTVYERFQNHINKIFSNHNIKLWYLVGGDHMEFLNAFSEHGRGIAIPRGGYKNQLTKLTFEARERCTISEEITQRISSTEIRSLEKYSPKRNGPVEDSPKKQKYYIRNDVAAALKDSPLEKSTKEADVIYKDISSIIKLHLPEHVTMEENIFTPLEKNRREKLISLDPFTPGDHNLHITRVFEAYGGQYSNLRHSNRVEHDNLEEQVKRLKELEYLLADDDIITGGTIKIIMKILEESNIKVKKYHSLTNVHNAFDVVDCRDFIMGSNYGGLTVEYFGAKYRAPYIFPHVNLNSRAKINSNEILPLSIKLWNYNYNLYKNSGVTVGDLKHSILQATHPHKTLLSDLCQNYERLLKNIHKNIL